MLLLVVFFKIHRLISCLDKLEFRMFVLDFFKIVSDVCSASDAGSIPILNNHDAAIRRRERLTKVSPNPNRALIEYVQWTYPEYFGFKLNFSDYLLANRHLYISKSGSTSLFFE
jgi:hypothetical protein